MLKINQS